MMTKKYEEIINEISTIIIRHNEDGTKTYIPFEPANSDYQAYLRWLENPEAEHLNGSELGDEAL